MVRIAWSNALMSGLLAPSSERLVAQRQPLEPTGQKSAQLLFFCAHTAFDRAAVLLEGPAEAVLAVGPEHEIEEVRRSRLEHGPHGPLSGVGDRPGRQSRDPVGVVRVLRVPEHLGCDTTVKPDAAR